MASDCWKDSSRGDEMQTLPELKVIVYSDYICPFCYIGNHRLQKLRDQYDLKINWRFLEIHPETSAIGEPIDSLDYPSETWQTMLENLRQLANEEDIPLGEIDFITNSRNALVLSEAAKYCGKEHFYALHDRLFKAYFVEGKNIGSQEVLEQIAMECNIDKETIDDAWQNTDHSEQLTRNYVLAREQDIQSVPSFIFADQILTGVVSEAAFRKAARIATSASTAEA
jgi:predicted DsbA family dithiol-disulfide isomerase